MASSYAQKALVGSQTVMKGEANGGSDVRAHLMLDRSDTSSSWESYRALMFGM